MRPSVPRCILALLTVACERGHGSTPPGSATSPPRSVEQTRPAAPDPLDAVTLPRPGPDDVDRALLPRLRRGLDLPLQLTEVLRSGDAWLVVYTYDENEAWWREVHREGKAAETLAALGLRRRQCEAAYRSSGEPDEDSSTVEDEPGDPLFSVDTEDAMEQRSCWELAMASLAAREGPLDGDCDAIGVARVTVDRVESLWRSTGSCAAAPAAFELIDVAGAGWPQLILQYSDVTWGSTRMGFQPATNADHLVILDPRPGHSPEMLEQTLDSEQLVDEAWHFSGYLAHVTFARGRHVTIYRQDWRTSEEECEPGSDGWVLEVEPGEYDEEPPSCTVELEVTRRLWDAKLGRWSDTVKAMPEPSRPPSRARELPIDLVPAPAKKKKAKKKP